MLRIIAGQYKSRKLQVPEGAGVRPTTDRMRERLFSMLLHPRYPDLYGARVADIFAGTGALGLEALSRGASHVAFVEKNSLFIDTLKQNIISLKASSQTSVMKTDATRLPACTDPYDLIFMDPPYHQGFIEQALKSALHAGWIKVGTTIVAEMGSDEKPTLPACLTAVDERKQGKQKILVLQKQ